MKQVLQNLRSGETLVQEVPAPAVTRGAVLIQTRASLISAGTERMLVEFGQASLLGKARAQPEKVRQVLDKIRTDGLLPTMEAVFNRLDEPLPLGYSNVGTVIEVGEGVTEFAPGDRVVSNGPHAEIVSVPRLLCAKVPDGVSDDQATFTVIASIGLQGVRLAQPQLGETVVVVGLGMIGLVTCQLLIASGCRVIATDVQTDRLAVADSYGCQTVRAGDDDPVAAALASTGGTGADAVIITAASKSDEIVHQSAQMCRKRGRIVLVGVVGLNLKRSDFYEKELSFQVSCSYGPGRYDPSYEQQGHDYPVGFVRWTEQRNFEAILSTLRSGKLDVAPLVTDRFELSEAVQAYRSVQHDSNCLGVVLDYRPDVVPTRAVKIESGLSNASPGGVITGVIGVGNYSKMTLLPALSKTDAVLKYVAGRSNGAAAQHLASKFGFEVATTDYRKSLDDDQVNAVVIATRHDSHGALTCEALAAHKHVFVEKPIALDVDQLRNVIEARRDFPDYQLMVGFNRRFSPHMQWIRERLLHRDSPIAINFTVNAGYIPPEAWVHDPRQGGGRIIGEACHFIDLVQFLTQSEVSSVAAHVMMNNGSPNEDVMSISLATEDGSVATINYFANGSKSYPKEQMEVFSSGRTIRMDNFRRTKAFGFGKTSGFRTSRQDKGHRNAFKAFVEVAKSGGAPLISFGEIVNTTLASFAAATAAREGRIIKLSSEFADLLHKPAREGSEICSQPPLCVAGTPSE